MRKRKEVRVGIIKVRDNKQDTQELLEGLYSRGWRVVCSYSGGNYIILENES